MKTKNEQNGRALSLASQGLHFAIRALQAAAYHSGHTTPEDENKKLLTDIVDLTERVQKLQRRVVKLRDRADGY